MLGFHYGAIGQSKQAIEELDKTIQLQPLDEGRKETSRGLFHHRPATGPISQFAGDGEKWPTRTIAFHCGSNGFLRDVDGSSHDSIGHGYENLFRRGAA